MRQLLLNSLISVGGFLALIQPVSAATILFNVNELLQGGPGSSVTSEDITLTYEVSTSGTGNYEGSRIQGTIPLAITNQTTNDGNAFDSSGNEIQNGALPAVVDVQNYTVLSFRWSKPVNFVSGFDINDLDFNHTSSGNPGYHDAAALIIERPNGTFRSVSADTFGSGLETYTANLISNPNTIVGGSGSLPNFLNDITSLNGYRNNNHTPNTASNESPTDPNFTTTFNNDLQRLAAFHVLYWNETEANSESNIMGIGFSDSLEVEENVEIPESPISMGVWVLLGLAGVLTKRNL